MTVDCSRHASAATHCRWPASSCCDGGATAPAAGTPLPAGALPLAAPPLAASPLAAAPAAALLRRLLPPAALPSARAASASSSTAVPVKCDRRSDVVDRNQPEMHRACLYYAMDAHFIAFQARAHICCMKKRCASEMVSF